MGVERPVPQKGVVVSWSRSEGGWRVLRVPAAFSSGKRVGRFGGKHFPLLGR